MFLTYQAQLQPTKAQYQRLDEILELQRQLYNAALQERIENYKFGKRIAAKRGATKPDHKLDNWKSINYIDQQTSLTLLRKEFIEYLYIPANLSRWTLRALDRAFMGLFKSGFGYPRFRSKSRYKSFGFAEMAGLRLKNNYLIFNSISPIKISQCREFPDDAQLTSCIFTKTQDKWIISFQLKTNDVINTHEFPNNSIGIDMGIESLVTLSTGEHIENIRVTKEFQQKQRTTQRALARCKKGSKRRLKVKNKLSSLHKKKYNKRKIYLHQVSAKLTRENSLIVVEDLKIKNMSASANGSIEEPGTNVAQKSGLNRVILDASWGTFINMLTYKAERAGGKVIKINPRGTSQECSSCGEKVKKELSERIHNCPHCGLKIHRDHNAAINILQRGLTYLSETSNIIFESRGVVVPEDANVIH